MNEITSQKMGVVTSAAAANHAYHQYIETLPYRLMQREWDRFVAAAGGANKWAFPPIADASHNPSVRMNPDVLYSVLSYDVTSEPLHLSVPVSRGPFWSLTLYRDNADSFFGIDDRTVEGDTFELIILGPNQTAPVGRDAQVVASPSNTGIAMVRCAVPGLDALKALDKLRKGAEAQLLKSS
jgi:uncharacterized membrane protein